MFSLLSHNTFGMDVKASQFVDFETEKDLSDVIADASDTPILVVGGGSNLLFMGDFDGTVLHSRIQDIEVVDETDCDLLLRVGSGVVWDNLVEYTVERGWQGIENLSSIPGEVGASAVQNVGAYGVEAGELIECVEALSLDDGSKRCFTHDECRFGYRTSIFKKEIKGQYVITYVTYKLRKKPRFCLSYGNLRSMVDELGGVTLANIRRAVQRVRAAKLPDPADLGSAGSFFMNPVVSRELAGELVAQHADMPQYATDDGRVKLSAAWLIEQCGWKGKRVGNVGVYDKQSLVIVNYGGATGHEVMDLAESVCQSVKQRFGVTLNMEVNRIG